MIRIGFVCAMVLLPIFTQAEKVIQKARCTLQEGVWYLDSSAKISLDKEPLAALKSGVALPFLREIEIVETDSWFAKEYYIEHNLRLRYNHITLSYQVEGSLKTRVQSFSDLGNALKYMATLQYQPLIAQEKIGKRNVSMRVRLKLDKKALPSALRLEAMISPQWQIESDWLSCL